MSLLHITYASAHHVELPHEKQLHYKRGADSPFRALAPAVLRWEWAVVPPGTPRVCSPWTTIMYVLSSQGGLCMFHTNVLG